MCGDTCGGRGLVVNEIRAGPISVWQSGTVTLQKGEGFARDKHARSLNSSIIFLVGLLTTTVRE